jgi:hypothetical protein
MRRVLGRRATNAPHIWTNFSQVDQRAGFPQHNSASVSIVTICWCRGTWEVPMSKVPIVAGFDVTEILMLTASVLVIAALVYAI